MKPAPEDVEARITAAESKIEQKADSITLSVEQKINSISVGGTNLYAGTQNFAGDTWTAKSLWTEDGSYNGCLVYKRAGQWQGLGQMIALEANTQYTLSAWLKQTDGGTVRYYDTKANGASSSDKGGSAVEVGTGWSRCHVTFTVSTADTYCPRFEQNGGGHSLGAGFIYRREWINAIRFFFLLPPLLVQFGITQRQLTVVRTQRLMAMRAIAGMILPKGHAFLPVAEFLGDPVMATLIAVLIAMFTFGLNRGRSMDQINDTLVSSIKIIAMMLLIIGGGGAFKQVLVDSGVDKYIASMMHETNISPLLMAWSIAAVLRIALGSATVAAITAGGIAAPLIATTGVSPELMVIAVGFR